MRTDKLTLKAQDALNQAQNIAMELNHYEIQPEHILKSLIVQENSIFSSIAEKLEVSVNAISSEIEDALNDLPRQMGGGSGGGVYSDKLRDVMNAAWTEAVKLNDDYLSTEHIILSLTGKGSNKVKDIFLAQR